MANKINYGREATDRLLQLMDRLLREGSIATDKAFADAIGCSGQTLYNMKMGTQNAPSIENIAKACLAFNVAPAWIILGDASADKIKPDPLAMIKEGVRLLEDKKLKKKK